MITHARYQKDKTKHASYTCLLDLATIFKHQPMKRLIYITGTIIEVYSTKDEKQQAIITSVVNKCITLYFSYVFLFVTVVNKPI